MFIFFIQRGYFLSSLYSVSVSACVCARDTCMNVISQHAFVCICVSMSQYIDGSEEGWSVIQSLIKPGNEGDCELNTEDKKWRNQGLTHCLETHFNQSLKAAPTTTTTSTSTTHSGLDTEAFMPNALCRDNHSTDTPDGVTTVFD